MEIYNRKVGVMQRRLMDCGPACLQSVAYHLGYNSNLKELRRIAGTNLTGTSMAGLIEAAQYLGMEVEGVWADFDALKKLKLPVIAHVKVLYLFSHFVVVYRIDDNNLDIMDPSIGFVRKMAIGNFCRKWTNSLIIFENIDSIDCKSLGEIG